MASFPIALHLIRLLFKYKNYKGCVPIFQLIGDNLGKLRQTEDVLPLKVQLNLAYFNGRFLLSQSEYLVARI